jgi:hypothetical protein
MDNRHKARPHPALPPQVLGWLVRIIVRKRGNPGRPVRLAELPTGNARMVRPRRQIEPKIGRGTDSLPCGRPTNAAPKEGDLPGHPAGSRGLLSHLPQDPKLRFSERKRLPFDAILYVRAAMQWFYARLSREVPEHPDAKIPPQEFGPDWQSLETGG